MGRGRCVCVNDLILAWFEVQGTCLLSVGTSLTCFVNLSIFCRFQEISASFGNFQPYLDVWGLFGSDFQPRRAVKPHSLCAPPHVQRF